MFKKLLSNLPFNPSLIGEVAFYAKRLHRESALRRMGLLSLSLALTIQTFAVVAPPQPSLASSTSDLMVGGFANKGEVVSYCKNNTRNYQKIAGHYGITCDDIQQAETVQIAPRDHAGKLYSMGRLSYGTEGETPVTIPGVGTVYLRHFWSLNHQPSYKALKGKTAYGMTFYILYDCGNLVFIGLPKPPEKCKWDKTLSKDSKQCFEPCKWNKNLSANSKQCFEPCPVTGKRDIPKNSPKCFVPCPIKGKQDIPKDSNKCTDPCPYNKNLSANSPKCFEACPIKGKQNISKDDEKCFEPCPVTGKSGIAKDSAYCVESCPIKGKESLSKDADDCFEPCKYNNALDAKDEACKPCEESQTSQDKTACVTYQKSASNTTKNISDANGTTAGGGDVIRYTLTTTNRGKETIKKFIVNENISDVLDYAEVVDLGGGTLGEEGQVSWPAVDLKAGQSITNTMSVKIKSPIPNTPASSSDAAHFDMKMTNVYGNVVTINLPPTITKTTEVVVSTLPNTGPGTSLIAATTITVIVGYFFARSRLMAQELDIVRNDFSMGSY